MPKIPLIFPFGGRADSDALYTQPGLTTRSALNVRGRDPITGRIRGAQRAGLSKFCPDVLGVGKVKALCSTAIDDRKVSYSFTAGTEDVLWDTSTPSKTSTLVGVTDRQGNVYAVDGNAGVAKYNSSGKLLMKVALPVADPNHVVRALFVDDADRIFAGVSAGGDVATAKVFCVLQRPQPGQVAADDPNQFFVLWEITPGAYTEELEVYLGSQLYCGHNYTGESRARVVVYDGLGLEPRELRRIEDGVPYPLNGMDVGEDGSVYCTSEDSRGDAVNAIGVQGSYRPGHPTQKGYIPPVTAWTLQQLVNSKRRTHSEYDAIDLDETDLDQTGRDVPTMDEGQQILRWRDKSGNRRHWFAGSLIASDETGPQYMKVGPGGLPAVHFTNVGSVKQSMVTLTNASVQKNLADQQRTAIPAHEGAMWALFILMRPTRDDDAGSSGPRVVFYAPNDVAASGNHGLWVNRACGAAEPGTYLAGGVTYFAKTDSVDDGACGAADQAAGNAFTSTSRHTDAVLVTILWDGGIDPNDTTKTRCLFRVNGAPVDRFEGLSFQSLQANYLAYAPSVATAVARRLNGEICHIVALGRIDRFDDTTEPKVATHDQLEFGDPAADQTDNEVAQIESWMMHRRGLGHLLGGSSSSTYPHFYGDQANGKSSPPDYGGSGRSVAFEEVLQRYPCATKHDNKGQLVWTCNENTHPDTGSNRGGIGYGVRVRKMLAAIEATEKVHVWLMGPPAVQATTGDVAVRKIIDIGTSFSGASADGAWRHKFVGNATPGYAHPRMASDKFGNLYLPGYNLGAGTLRALHILKKDGVAGVAVQLTEFLLPSPADLAHAVALPPDALTPDYRTDLLTGPAEFVYLFTQAGDGLLDPADSVFKIGLVVTNSQASGSPRAVVTVGVSGSDIKLVDEVGVTVPSGGSGVIDATSQYVTAFQADREIVVVDGLKYWVYSPLTGLVTALESDSAGEIPPRAKLGCMWRHRLVLARFADKPGRYAASAIGDIRDWDLHREPRLSTMAFDASLTRAGEVEDSIVALMPLSDDLLLVLGESRILRLTGDPQDGGQIDKVSDDIGGVFGGSWCKDQGGRAFFFGNPPGLYMTDGVTITPLTRDTIEETEFSDIDFNVYRIELAWDPIQKGVVIAQVPHGSGGTLVRRWFWEEKTHRLVQGGAIWPDASAIPGVQPTAFSFLAGDSTRALLVGCEDGYVRMVDAGAADDDGSAIDSYFEVLLTPPQNMVEYRLISTQVVLADDQSGCRLELFSSEEADTVGPIEAAEDLQPGVNDPFRGRVRGPTIRARLRSALAGRRWAFERAEAEIVACAPIKNRTT